MTRRLVSEILSSNRIVQLVGSASVHEASKLMAKEHVGAVLIIEQGRLEGVFTERDALNSVLAKELDPRATKVSEVMTRKPICIAPTATAIDALRIMRDGGFRHLPVAEGSVVLGVISLRDFFGAELAEVEHEEDFQTRIVEGPG